MTKLENLMEAFKTTFSSFIVSMECQREEITLITETCYLKSLLQQLRDDEAFAFDQLIDLCGVDYLHYGVYDWQTESATETGFSRGVEKQPSTEKAEFIKTPEQQTHEACLEARKNIPSRFAVVYHLLSTRNNHRVRVKLFLEETLPILPSVHEIWKVANWFEREAFDLYGILFENHPDLRRILTDYGFIGYPFRKDFPISGHVEMRYDAKLEKVIYEPVDIEPRTLVPKVIREDNRYLGNAQPKDDR
ncbi:MAG: NADH-quinone oxidoreductase subunit C [Legionella sp.]|nr:NADH-quinone oxidoreductase subunit C [Legionella sp.]